MVNLRNPKKAIRRNVTQSNSDMKVDEIELAECSVCQFPTEIVLGTLINI